MPFKPKTKEELKKAIKEYCEKDDKTIPCSSIFNTN